MNTGKLTLRPFSIVTKIIYDKDTKKAKGVEVLDGETNKTYEFYSKIKIASSRRKRNVSKIKKIDIM